MQKLTQTEAQDLICKAWKMVNKHRLGEWRFGATVWKLLPDQITDQNPLFLVEFCDQRRAEMVIDNIYEFFVEDSNN